MTEKRTFGRSLVNQDQLVMKGTQVSQLQIRGMTLAIVAPHGTLNGNLKSTYVRSLKGCSKEQKIQQSDYPDEISQDQCSIHYKDTD